MNDRFAKAVEFFNAGRYFDAHEAWEDEWRESGDPERRWLQGLVQVAVALHHRSTGNIAGAESVMDRALKNLETCPATLRGVNVAALRRDLAVAITEWKAGRVAAQIKLHP
jgi:predicted metal-dependent hydrolase